MNKKVIVSGVSGQLGSYFVEYLLKNTNYEIYGLVRRLSVKNHENIKHLAGDERFKLLSADLNDEHSLYRAVSEVSPDYFINCAAQSYVSESWISPVNTFQTDCISIINILEIIRKLKPNCRFLNFGSSEVFGEPVYSPQDVNHPFKARSPYGAAKAASQLLVKMYRENYGLYALQPICFNFESVRRNQDFVSRKITQGIARLKYCLDNGLDVKPLEIGDVESRRDWSDCEDFVDGAWRIINQEKYRADLKDLEFEKIIPQLKEYILSSGESHSIRDLINCAIESAGIIAYWSSGPMSENKIYNPRNDMLVLNNAGYSPLIIQNPNFFRKNDSELLIGDNRRTKEELGWVPETSFYELIKKMTLHDIKNYSP